MIHRRIADELGVREGQVQVASEALAMLEPFLALGLHFVSSLGRCWVRLEGEIIQIGAHGNAEAAVIIVDKRKPATRMRKVLRSHQTLGLHT